MPTTVDVIYQLENINAEEGIDVFEIAPVLMHFGELIRSANTVLGYEQKIDIRIKPFKEGSWITQFVLENAYISNLLSYLQSKEGTDLLLLLAFLGLNNIREGIVGVAGIIRFTKGVVSNFIKSKDGNKVTYINEKGEKLTVSLAEHKLVQSPLIQNNYYNCTIAPLDKFPSATAVTVKVNKEGEPEQKFTQADKPAFDAYIKSELLEDVEDNVVESKGIFVKPKRGSYSGTEQAYSFIIGDTTLWPVAIEDEIFLNNLRSGDIRLYAEDVLKVDLEVRQKKDSTNKVRTSYAITKVLEYIKYEKPKQLNMKDFIKKDDK
ncbi:MAG: hypothetical protein ACOX1J_07075 [Dethiobacteria bacterium]